VSDQNEPSPEQQIDDSARLLRDRAERASESLWSRLIEATGDSLVALNALAITIGRLTAAVCTDQEVAEFQRGILAIAAAEDVRQRHIAGVDLLGAPAGNA
jgi:hypothetical protein